MSWKDKYFYTFRNINDVGYVVRILHNITGTTAAIEIRGDKTPLTVTLPPYDKFDPVRGTGVGLNIVSETNLQHLNLYTNDMFGYQIQVDRMNRFSINASYTNASTPPPITVGVNYTVAAGTITITDDGSLAAIYNVGDTFPYLTSTSQMPDLFVMAFSNVVLTSGTIYKVDGSFTNSTCPPSLPFDSYIVESGTVAVIDDGSLAALYSAGDTFAYSTSTSQLPDLMVMVFTDAVFSTPPKTIWHGYLDAELYSEPFNSIDNYTVSLTGNDGLNLLERLYYVASTGTTIAHYSGIESQWTIITRILEKLDIDWNAIYVNISTTSSSVTVGANETIFHQTFIRNDNWYNEDDEPETCRKVLEEILRPYGAFLQINENDVYITDYNVIYDGSSAYKKFDGATYAYVSTPTINMLIGDASHIGFASNSQNFSILSGINKQVISYSPYKKTSIIDFDAANDNFQTVNAVEHNGSGSYTWDETYYDTSDTWDRTSIRGFFCQLSGTTVDINDTEVDYYLKNITEVNNSYNGVPSGVFTEGAQTFQFKGDLTTIVSSSNKYAIKVEASVYACTKSNLNDPNETGIEVGFINLFTDLIIGNKKYNWHVPCYQPTQVNGWKNLTDYGHMDLPYWRNLTNLSPWKNIADQWVDLTLEHVVYTGPQDYVFSTRPFLVPLEPCHYGDVSFIIYGYTAYNTFADDTTNFYNLRIKDVKLTVVDEKGNDVEKIDLEFTGYMDKKFKDEGEQITLYNGTNYNDFPTERGGLLTASTGCTYFNIKEWTKEGVTDNIENLLLRSIESNYYYPTFNITMTLNMLDNIVGYVTYDHYLQQTFSITSCIHNFEESTSEVTLTETTKDNLLIQKSF